MIRGLSEINTLRKIADIMNEVQYDNSSLDLEWNDFLKEFIDLLTVMKKSGQTLFFIGNGGSAGIAIHMTGDYLKNGGLKTHSMFDISTITCIGNDLGYEYIFSKQLQLVAKENDLLIAISSSGNSPNILNAVEIAQKKGCKVITFSGFRQDNELYQLGDYNVYVPSLEYGIVESVHNIILQQIVDEIVSRDGVGLK